MTNVNRTYILTSAFKCMATLALVMIIISCRNDNLADLAKKGNVKDTTSTSPATPSTGSPPGALTGTTTGTTAPTTALTSFTKDIKPIIAKYNCAGCHGSSYASYNGLSSLAKTGQLYGTMSWSSGYRKMPPGQNASASELANIADWIKQGTLNN